MLPKYKCVHILCNIFRTKSYVLDWSSILYFYFLEGEQAEEKSKSCIITANDGIFLQSRINVRSAVMFIVGTFLYISFNETFFCIFHLMS